MEKIRVCCWVLQPAGKNTPAVYCGKKVNYTIVRDDDNRPVRKYNPWCNDHAIIASSMDDDE